MEMIKRRKWKKNLPFLVLAGGGIRLPELFWSEVQAEHSKGDAPSWILYL